MTTTTPRPTAQVTIFDNPETNLASEYSDRDYYMAWLQMEVERWQEKGREAWIETDKEGRVALFTWAHYMKPVEGEQ